MTREEAYKAMQEGKKIAHNYFTTGEYYHIVFDIGGKKILAEDGVNHTSTFRSTDGNDWRKDGWYIVE